MSRPANETTRTFEERVGERLHELGLPSRAVVETSKASAIAWINENIMDSSDWADYTYFRRNIRYYNEVFREIAQVEIITWSSDLFSQSFDSSNHLQESSHQQVQRWHIKKLHISRGRRPRDLP